MAPFVEKSSCAQAPLVPIFSVKLSNGDLAAKIISEKPRKEFQGMGQCNGSKKLFLQYITKLSAAPLASRGSIFLKGKN